MYNESEPMLGGGRGKPSSAPVATGSGSIRTMRLETPTARCNDAFFAFLFLSQALVITIFAIWKGIPALMQQVEQHQQSNTTSHNYSMIFALVSGLMAISIVFSAMWMKFLMSYAESMIRIALWMNVGLTLVFAFTTFLVNPIMALILIGLAVLNVWYIRAVRNRIAFASANLKIACSAISVNSSIFLVAFSMVLKQTIWLLLWSLSAIGIYQLFKEHDPTCQQQNGFDPQHLCGGGGAGVVFFFLLISIYWGQQVFQNLLTCTTAGVVAAWWYQPQTKHTTLHAFYRASTTSFGSICFGSLLVAILQALRTMASMLKEKATEEDNVALACVACLAECILNCLEGIMEYINQWAFVYVGIYGYDFKTSGKAVMDLFNNRGWTMVINDDLTSSALTFGALGVGCVGCVIGLLMVQFSPFSWFVVLGSKNAAFGVLGVIGFISGMSVAMILANVVITALHTVFVCFAEDPIALSRHHPEEYHTLIHGWRQFHGDALVSAYGSAV